MHVFRDANGQYLLGVDYDAGGGHYSGRFIEVPDDLVRHLNRAWSAMPVLLGLAAIGCLIVFTWRDAHRGHPLIEPWLLAAVLLPLVFAIGMALAIWRAGLERTLLDEPLTRVDGPFHKFYALLYAVLVLLAIALLLSGVSRLLAIAVLPLAAWIIRADQQGLEHDLRAQAEAEFEARYSHRHAAADAPQRIPRLK